MEAEARPGGVGRVAQIISSLHHPSSVPAVQATIILQAGRIYSGQRSDHFLRPFRFLNLGGHLFFSGFPSSLFFSQKAFGSSGWLAFAVTHATSRDVARHMQDQKEA